MSRKQQRRPDPRHKKCEFCDKEVVYIDYKDYPIMRPFIDYFGNIMARYYSGVCLKHQKMLKNSVERARFMGMMAYRK
ncbi:MAG: 30S ribosomal protein S18 [Candidatus Peribacter sp.]|nr:30S ribosomal protein S18 [Candidatus Peribacter sp.]MBT4393221.1 30S ribosomal protein S18 [Candidatus Peribacter sp.]MBT4601116.1 30S ribosomal protein S18 [Candidatus Peribacter sp.]MBT5148924.1 30S ribosomal protein S18 [Candidatus Peribacter sp.]MBT5637197.1 30S ribosomal protein S18 [Candidatus Peribacter sp.]